MKKFKSYKEESKSNWGARLEDGDQVSNDNLKLGAILRIADATEAMAKNYTQIEENLKYFKGLAKRRLEGIVRLENKNRGLRSVITRMKNKNKK